MIPKSTPPHSMHRFWTMSTTLLLLFSISLSSCSHTSDSPIAIYQTSQSGDNLKLLTSDLDVPTYSTSRSIHLEIKPEENHQTYIGFGASFTESSAWNLATIPEELRKEVLTRLFSPTAGAGFTLTRTHINSSDYSNGHYTYVADGDTSLASFTVREDMKGFSGQENDQVRGIELVEPAYDIIPMILESQQVEGADFKIIASPWSPPSWMKSGETATMTNGSIMPKYYGLWARYISKYINAYAEEGIDIWGITPQNEPLHAHDARWDSNGLTPEQGRTFLRDHLGPQLVADGHLDGDDLEAGVRVLIYDHNKSTMNDYVDVTYQDAEAAKYAWGTAIHWYANSELDENDFYTSDLDSLRTRWPSKGLIHTESSIDIDAEDPIGQYWRESTDYAGTFVPFDTYAFDIISDLNHGVQGYVEWCMILSNKGQPNPYDNFNSAPVLIDPINDEVIYTPLYYLLSHFSKFIRPDAQRITLDGDKVDGLAYTAAMNTDGSIAVVIFNSHSEVLDIQLTLNTQNYHLQMPARSMQTIVLQSPEGQ